MGGSFCSTSTNIVSSTTTPTTFDSNNKYFLDRAMAARDIDSQLLGNVVDDNRKSESKEEQLEDYKVDDGDSDSESIISESIIDPVFTSEEVDGAEPSSSPPSSQVTTTAASIHADTHHNQISMSIDWS